LVSLVGELAGAGVGRHSDHASVATTGMHEPTFEQPKQVSRR
jgi:hypothetical protein